MNTEYARSPPNLATFAAVPGPMETPLLDWLLRATPLGPERTQELMLAAVPRRAGVRPAGRGSRRWPVSSPALRVATSPVPTCLSTAVEPPASSV